LIYEVEFVVPESALNGSSDEDFEQVWPEFFESPCRSYTLDLSRADFQHAIGFHYCDVRLRQGSIVLADEVGRCTELAVNASRGGSLKIEYPLQGATYTVHWCNLRKRTRADDVSIQSKAEINGQCQTIPAPPLVLLPEPTQQT